MALHYITKEKFGNFLEELEKNYSVFIPVKKGDHRFYTRFGFLKQPETSAVKTTGSEVVIGEVRTSEPLKLFFFKSRERVAEGFNDEIPITDKKPYCIVGAKACDLKGFKVQDRVFKENDYQDPFYIKRREENLVISADCTCAIETCYCLSLHLNPYPEENFDINLSEINGGYVVESGSDRGEEILRKNSSLFSEANPTQLSQRDEQRKRVVREVRQNIKENKIPDQDSFKGIIEKNYNDPVWKEEAEECVECGACNMICPTCHCFLLYDQKNAESIARLRVWDSCMIKDFAKVAGGANPRPQLWMRLRNRFEKKFDFFPKISDIYACTGCGRCISACPAKIDIRNVLRRLVENVQK